MKGSGRIRVLVAVLLAGTGMLDAVPASWAQDSTPSSPPAAPQADTPKAQEAPQTTGKSRATRRVEHRFWDKENDGLFAGVGASRTLDYFSTLNMRRRGRQEILLTNAAVDNHAAFATIEVAGTAASIGVAYLFHRYEHHRLERWTSFLHIGLATTARCGIIV